MVPVSLELGGVYQPDWDARPFRIIGLDEHEVFYDCQWEHDGLWTFQGNFNRTCIFYRTPTALFAQRSMRTGHLPFTDKELAAFRPDLPMRLGRNRELSWNSSWDSGILEQPQMTANIALDGVVLVPYGSKGGLKGGVVLRASSVGSGFTVRELLLAAKRIQEQVNPQTSDGVGLYRLGWQKRLPSYYIGEYSDRAGHVT